VRNQSRTRALKDMNTNTKDT